MNHIIASHSRILVTGATGFIGRAVCRALQNQGFTVRAAVRIPLATKDRIPADEVVMIDDINSGSDWSGALMDIDAIIHLAAWNHSSVDRPVNVPEACNEVNVYGSRRLAEMAAIAGVRRIVYMSTVKVYGEGRALAYTEKDIPNPDDLYGDSKWQAEQILKNIAGQTGMELVILRPPLVYGPGVKENFLRLIKLVDAGIPLPLEGMKNRRSVVYVGNLTDAVMKCIHHPAAKGETFLVSDGCDVSITELMGLMAASLNRKMKWFYLPETWLKAAGRIIGREREVRRLYDSLYVDINKIKTMLDWVPPFSMEEGIKETIQWYKSR